MFNNSKKLYEIVQKKCAEWDLRTFSMKEKLQDTGGEAFELFEAIAKRKNVSEIGLEYGDVLFTLIRSGKNENRSVFVRYFFYTLPGKRWLERKLKILDKRFEWWMKNYHMKSIRNYKNPEKRKKLIERHYKGKYKNTWIP